MTPMRAFLVTALAALFLLIAGAPMFENPPTLYTGVHLRNTGAAVQPNIVRVDANSPAYRAGLRTGDVLSCLSVRDYTLLFPNTDFYPHPAYKPGTPISLCVRRGGHVTHITFIADPRPPAGYLYRSIGIAALRACVLLIFLISGIALVLGRPGAMTWIFFAYCAGNMPSSASSANWTMLPPALYAVTAAIPAVISNTSVGFLLLFTLCVPDDRVPLGWRRYAYYAAWLLTVGYGLFNVAQFALTSVSFAPIVQYTIDEALTALTVCIVVARLASMKRQERTLFAWAAFAIIWGVIANDARNVLAIETFAGVASAVLTVVMPLCLMYAILRRHVIDVRFVISRTVVYGSITTLVVGVIGAVDWATSAYLTQARLAMAVDAAVTIGLGFILHRTYAWLESAADFILFRKKHEAEAYLNRLARTLLRANREETVDRALVHDPCEKFELTMAALFRAEGNTFGLCCAEGCDGFDAAAFDRDHDLVRFLLTERTRIHIHDLRKHVAAQFLDWGDVPALAIPLFEGDDLSGFAVYGIHRAGTKLDPDEVETLEHLCEVACQAYVRIQNVRYRMLQAPPLPA